MTAQLIWWSVSSFIPLVAVFLADKVESPNATEKELELLQAEYSFLGLGSFSLG